MPYQPFLIAAPKVGLERDLEPWLLPNDAYPTLEDCYLWRGRIKKKEGYRLLDRLRQPLGTLMAPVTLLATATNPTFTIADLLADANVTVTTAAGSQVVRTFLPNAQIAPGSLVIDVATGTIVFTDNGNGGFTSVPPQGGTSTINYASGAITLHLATAIGAGSPVKVSFIYFPDLPVMGLPTLENVIKIDSGTTNKEILMAFDTAFSYLFDGTTLQFINKSFYKTTGTAFTWTGTNANFFWSTNYLNCMWSTNFVPGFQNMPEATVAASGDGIRWFDQDQSGWVNFLPNVDSAKSQFLQGALMMFAYKGRLIALNTWEGPNYAGRQNFAQRARWSQIGTPFGPAGVPLPTGFAALGGTASDNAWVSDVPGFGGFFDAPTLEMIISAQFVKDTLIVFFERSTWQLRYTGNELLPFAWEKINTELGATSTFSEVPFDKIVIGIGDVGIHGCDSVNVERIDQRIPDEVFSIQNSQTGRARVYGIRDYFNQLVYWTLPYVGASEDEAFDDDMNPLPPSGVDLVYPNKILVYNYIDQSYSFYNDSFTCFGYYSKADGDLIWGNATDTWETAVYKWVPTISQESFPFVVAGNQQGWVHIFDPEIVLNDRSLFIQAVAGTTITSPSHNLRVGSVIRIQNGTDPITFYTIIAAPTSDTFVIDAAYVGTFTGNAFIFVVSNINIITKRFNPFINEGIQVRLGYVDYYLDKTDGGEITTNLYLNEDTSLPTNQIMIATTPETTYSTSPDTAPYVQQKLWKRAYYSNVSQLFQIQITLSNAQLKNLNIVSSDIEVHGIVLWFDTAGRLIDV